MSSRNNRTVNLYVGNSTPSVSGCGQQIPVKARGGFAAVVHDTVRHAESVERPTTCPRYARAQLFFHLAKFQISREHQKPDEADAHS